MVERVSRVVRVRVVVLVVDVAVLAWVGGVGGLFYVRKPTSGWKGIGVDAASFDPTLRRTSLKQRSRARAIHRRTSKIGLEVDEAEDARIFWPRS